MRPSVTAHVCGAGLNPGPTAAHGVTLGESPSPVLDTIHDCPSQPLWGLPEAQTASYQTGPGGVTPAR